MVPAATASSISTARSRPHSATTRDAIWGVSLSENQHSSRREGRPSWVHGVASSTQPGALPLGTAERHAQRTPIQAAVRVGFDYEIRGGPAKLTPRGPPLIVRKM